MMRVLIVEDEFLIQDALSMAVEDVPGCEVVAAVDEAEEALKLMDAATADLAVLDIKLAGKMDGVELAQELRRRHGTDVVFLSGSGDPATLRRIQEFGPLAFIRKPFHPRDLQRLLSSRLAMNGPPPERGTGGSATHP
ncbi:response regulator [Azospirillum sp. SYSU D00513]|uniref:response regulator n=1 Tax=Azospirillum sp. SYSU D00513 TaxID=2812561 RepID=UPI001A95B11B|nr:response regulator [Azospirillum sp. SYSU D00513]